jgi:hypothetical protein
MLENVEIMSHTIRQINIRDKSPPDYGPEDAFPFLPPNSQRIAQTQVIF